MAVLERAAGQSVQQINEMMSTVIADNTIEAMVVRTRRPEYRDTISYVGPGSSASIVEAMGLTP
eukprot:COSAG06_NODE_26373_length_616_cov_1.075435_2_plen_64_part_00